MSTSRHKPSKVSGCPRDEGGFCLVAQIGHRHCPTREGGCTVTDPQAAYAEAYDAAITRIFADWRRRLGIAGGL
ncbi:MAG: hypothetical protein WAP03_13210 [Methylorubrum rhodinum]|uniref:hypothetical protein n=1 Tax=Methylorubrum rhodinum TaxID=29428 RepID=UPI003BB1B6FF